jgi:exonuclease VII large subunit
MNKYLFPICAILIFWQGLCAAATPAVADSSSTANFDALQGQIKQQQQQTEQQMKQLQANTHQEISSVNTQLQTKIKEMQSQLQQQVQQLQQQINKLGQAQASKSKS